MKMLLPRMIDDALKLTLDVLFPRPPRPEGEAGEAKQNFKIEQYADNENLWKHIYTMK